VDCRSNQSERNEILVRIWFAQNRDETSGFSQLNHKISFKRNHQRVNICFKKSQNHINKVGTQLLENCFYKVIDYLVAIEDLFDGTSL